MDRFLTTPSRLKPTEFLDFAKQQGSINRIFAPTMRENLNFKQAKVFDFVTCSLKNQFPNLLICHGAGTGKSFIISALRNYCFENRIQFRVMAFTGCAAFSVGGQTIHSSLSIPINYRKHIPEKHVEHPRNFYKNVKLIIVDEMSMVGLSLFGYMERRLRAIYASDQPFGGINVVIMGDFSQ